MAPKQKRKKELELISYEELLGSSSMTGLVSFLDIHPGQSKQPASLPRPDEALATVQALAIPQDERKPVHLLAEEQVSRSLPASRLPSDSSVLTDSSVPPDSSFQPDGILLTPSKPDKVRTMVKREPTGLQRISSFVPGSDLRASVNTAIEQPESLPSSKLQAGSNLPPDSDLRPSEVRPAEFDPYDSSEAPGSSLLSGGDLRTVNGRTVRLRLARSVQDAHTNGEHMLLTAMWKKGSPETEHTRLLRAGLAELSRWTGSHKTSCRAYLRALIAKLALEEAQTFDAAAGSEGARVYRIFSFNTILDRRRRANLTHVIRTGAVSFVDPKTGEKILPGSSLPPASTLPPDSNVPPDRNLPSDSGSNHPPTPGSNQLPINKNTEEVIKQTTATHVYDALSQYGQVDHAALTRLMQACHEQAPDTTAEEMVHFIHQKGALTKARDSRIQNPIGFLIEAVPKCFAGESFRQYRQSRQPASAAQAPDQAERDRAWGKEHEAELNDPNVPDEIKRVIRRCLGLNDGT